MKASGTFHVHASSGDDLGRHAPAADAANSWQESWGLAWHDPQTRTDGWNHIGLQRRRGFADVWSWLAVDGAIIGRYNCLREPLPDRDLPDFEIGGMDVRNQDLRNLTITASYPGSRADLAYTAYTDPFVWDIRPDKIDMGMSHYESQGRVRGRVTVGDREIDVNDAAWQDHSWGPCDWSQSLAHRWIMANLGPDLFLSVWQVMTSGGKVLAGFVYDGDTFHGIERITFGAELYDNGHQPHRCDASGPSSAAATTSPDNPRSPPQSRTTPAIGWMTAGRSSRLAAAWARESSKCASGPRCLTSSHRSATTYPARPFPGEAPKGENHDHRSKSDAA
jgi:hypothetical protein